MKGTYSFFVATTLLFVPFVLFASETEGTIDATNKYAWSENIGWINFGADESNVLITDSTLTGFAWSENVGWIRLDPPESGVINDGEGDLSGSAWGEGTGYIDFDGVSIDESGIFSGFASSSVTGRISFNCSNTSSCSSSDFKVSTDWRPESVRESTTSVSTEEEVIASGGGSSSSGTTTLETFIEETKDILTTGGVLDILYRFQEQLGSLVPQSIIASVGSLGNASHGTEKSFDSEWEISSGTEDIEEEKKEKSSVYQKRKANIRLKKCMLASI